MNAGRIRELACKKALDLIEDGLKTDDDRLKQACEKLSPYQKVISSVSASVIKSFLSAVPVDESLEEEEAVIKCLNDMVKKLESMKWALRSFL